MITYRKFGEIVEDVEPLHEDTALYKKVAKGADFAAIRKAATAQAKKDAKGPRAAQIDNDLYHGGRRNIPSHIRELLGMAHRDLGGTKRLDRQVQLAMMDLLEVYYDGVYMNVFLQNYDEE